jgi:heme/copper-type cytochrome/quinol oxidase subunit 3
MILTPEKGRTNNGMAAYLFTLLVIFGGAFILFGIFRLTHKIEFHIASSELSILLGTFNAIVLLTGSLTFALSAEAAKNNKKRLAGFLNKITILTALFFLINRGFEFSVKITEGNFPGVEGFSEKSSGTVIFYNFYYIISALHIALLLLAIIFLLAGLKQLKASGNTAAVDSETGNTNLIWQSSVAVWLLFFPLFYLLA